jgi:hypothetical protein
MFIVKFLETFDLLFLDSIEVVSNFGGRTHIPAVLCCRLGIVIA